jgi:hypothetical protein
MHKDIKQNFFELYEAVRDAHPFVKEMDRAIVQEYERGLCEVEQSRNTGRYIVAALSAIFTYVTYFILVTNGYPFSQLLQSQVSFLLSQRQFLDTHQEILVGTAVILIAIPFYTLVMPNVPIKLSNTRFPLLTNFKGRWNQLININKRSITYLSFAFFSNYLAMAFLLLYLYSYTPIREEVTKWITIVWLMIAMVLISSLVVILLFCTLVFLTRPRKYRSEISYRCIISYEILLLINRLDEFNGSRPGISSLEMSNSIYKISYLMESMYTPNPLKRILLKASASREDKDSMQLHKSEMHKRAKNFKALAKSICWPKEEAGESPVERLCRYLNFFISRESLDEQQDEALSSSQENIKGVRKLLWFLLLLCYMVLPILILIALLAIQINIPPAFQSSLNVFYIIWIMFGLLAYSEKFPAIKEFFMEILKTLINRK